MLFAIVGSINAYVMAVRISRCGRPFTMPGISLRNDLSTYKEYWATAPSKGWSRAPLWGLLICIAGLFASMGATAMSGSANAQILSRTISFHRKSILFFTMTSTFMIAIAFSYGVYRLRKNRLQNKETDILPSYARFEILLSVVAWTVFFITAAAVILE